MEKVPEMISTKDLAYLSDIFTWHFIASKKCHHYQNQVQDEEIKNTIERIGDMHAHYCHEIITILQ